MKKNCKKYVIGVDGGATKTIAALADLDGNILKTFKTGSSSPRNIGIEEAAENVAKGISRVFKDNIVSVFVGLPAVEEEYKTKTEEIKKRIVKKTAKKFNVKVGSDQLVAFRSGTDERNGVVAIAGTGCVVHAWRGGREEKASGWGWLADEGSAVWIGKKVFEVIFKDMDGRGTKTELTKMVLDKMKVSTPEKLAEKTYGDKFLETISYLSVIADQAGKKGDKTARKILREGGEEVALSVDTVVKKINFQGKSFPLVLVGSMFKSQGFRKSFELYTRGVCSKADLIYPEALPVSGAVKLAIENIK